MAFAARSGLHRWRHWRTMPLLALLLAGCTEELYTGLAETEANEMVAILRQNGIDADRAVGPDKRLSVRVDSDRFADAVMLLKRHGYPKPSFASMEDVFTGGGMVPSPLEERARLIYALGQELSRTLSDIDGVLTARVHVVLPETDLLRRDVAPSSAAVFIRHRPEADIQRILPQIKMLVSRSIAGLAYDNVSVVLLPASAPGVGMSIAGNEGPVVAGRLGP